MNTHTIASAAVCLCAVTSALAQLSIPWYTIDGGGGTSTGGNFALSGTIGQHDAGAMSGGVYTLTGGFWAGAPGGTTGCNLADITEQGGTLEEPGSPDGQLTLEDILVFIDAFNDASGCPGSAPCNLADITESGGTLEEPGSPDGQLSLDDILVFIDAYNDGCA